MSVAKVIEITADSPKSFDDAIHQAISRAAQTIDHLEGAWVKDQEVLMHDGKISGYRVNLKATFILDDKAGGMA